MVLIANVHSLYHFPVLKIQLLLNLCYHGVSLKQYEMHKSYPIC